jgi:hypothetical protein
LITTTKKRSRSLTSTPNTWSKACTFSARKPGISAIPCVAKSTKWSAPNWIIRPSTASPSVLKRSCASPPSPSASPKAPCQNTWSVPKEHEQPVELNVARFLYDSKLGWNAEGAGSTNIKGNTFTFGIISDNDTLVERYAGIKARYERKHVGTDRLRFHFEFDSFHEQWNQATLLATNDQAGIYRSREVFTPEATFVIAAPLELDFGTSFSRFRPEQPGAKIESSNAVVSTLRYHQRWGSIHDPQDQELNASYSMRAGIRAFETDTDFTRQMGQARYRFRHDHNAVEVGFVGGEINGNAPLFEKFVAGNATILRGWNKLDLDPLGGSHIMAGSIDYSFHWLQVFYDTGAIWDVSQEREQRQSVGAGFKAEGFQLAVAFPLRSGHVEPVFYAGLNF